MAGWRRRQRMRAEISERSYLQRTIIAAMALGALGWTVLCALFLVFDGAHGFFSVTGVFCFGLGLVFLSPVFGVFIYLATKLAYFRLKAQGKLPPAPQARARLVLYAAAACLPVIGLLSWLSYDMYYEAIDSSIRIMKNKGQR